MTTSPVEPSVDPGGFSARFPSDEILSSEGLGWRDITLQRHKALPGASALPPSTHHRLALQMSGTALFEGVIEGRRVRQWSAPGQCYVFPAGMPVTRTLTGRPEGLLIYLPVGFIGDAALQALDQDPARVCLVEQMAVPDPVVDQLGRLLLKEAEHATASAQLMVDSLSMALAIQLLRCHSNHAPKRMHDAGLPGARLSRVVEYMQAHLSQDITLAQLACIAGLSTAQFTRAFRKACNETPYRYLIRLRLERACELLRDTQLSVMEISLRCGFEQPSHFATVFRQRTGVSPRTWRAMQR